MSVRSKRKRQMMMMTVTTDDKRTYHAELETRLAVSTVPPRTTSFIPSTTELWAALPTSGCTSDLMTSIAAVRVRVHGCYENENRVSVYRGEKEKNKWRGSTR